MTEQMGTTRARRRRASREEAEADLFAAALALLRRDGVLAGVNLREVAKQARVNHGQIYQYFRTRQALLRAAISHLLAQDPPEGRLWDLPFPQRRRAIWRWALRHPDVYKLQALLALDEDPDMTLFPALEHNRQALARDVEQAHLPLGADTDVVHAMTAVTYLGYCVFREAMAKELGIDPAELDSRATAVYDKMIEGLATADS